MSGGNRGTEDDKLKAWRAAGRRLRRQLELDGEFDKRVRQTFSRTLSRQYVCPVYQAVADAIRTSHGRDQDTLQTLARVLRAAETTTFRWDGDLLGTATTPSRTVPLLNSFLAMLAVFNVAREVLPRGLDVVLNCYRETVHFVARELGQHGLTSDLPTPEEVVCLHFAARSVEWSIAGDHGSDPASGLISQTLKQLHAIYPHGTIQMASDVRSVLDKYYLSWCVLESLVQYEWFDYFSDTEVAP